MQRVTTHHTTSMQINTRECIHTSHNNATPSHHCECSLLSLESLLLNHFTLMWDILLEQRRIICVNLHPTSTATLSSAIEQIFSFFAFFSSPSRVNWQEEYSPLATLLAVSEHSLPSFPVSPSRLFFTIYFSLLGRKIFSSSLLLTLALTCHMLPLCVKG